jgi:hypothetical protein
MKLRFPTLAGLLLLPRLLTGAPANDDWDAPTDWATDGPHPVNLQESTFESLEPDWAYRFAGWENGAGSVWFRWTAGQTGWYEAEATGPVPTTVIVYEDSSLISLTRVENGNLLRSVTRPRGSIHECPRCRTHRWGGASEHSRRVLRWLQIVFSHGWRELSIFRRGMHRANAIRAALMER